MIKYRTKAMTVEEVFWSRVNKDGPQPYPGMENCWLWEASKNSNGYGTLTVEYTVIYAHHYVFELFGGVIPKGKQLNHRCDVRNCVKPDHIYLGTQQDNVTDMWSRGRARTQRGSTHYKTKLTDDVVRAIRAKFDAGIKVKELASEFNLSNSATRRIAQRKSWKGLK